MKLPTTSILEWVLWRTYTHEKEICQEDPNFRWSYFRGTVEWFAESQCLKINLKSHIVLCGERSEPPAMAQPSNTARRELRLWIGVEAKDKKRKVLVAWFILVVVDFSTISLHFGFSEFVESNFAGLASSAVLTKVLSLIAQNSDSFSYNSLVVNQRERGGDLHGCHYVEKG